MAGWQGNTIDYFPFQATPALNYYTFQATPVSFCSPGAGPITSLTGCSPPSRESASQRHSTLHGCQYNPRRPSSQRPTALYGLFRWIQERGRQVLGAVHESEDIRSYRFRFVGINKQPTHHVVLRVAIHEPPRDYHPGAHTPDPDEHCAEFVGSIPSAVTTSSSRVASESPA